MMIKQAVELVKSSLGITSSVRDDYIEAIVKGVVHDIENRIKVKLDDEDIGHLMFVVDMAAWRYSNQGTEGIPRHLEFRLHNLMFGSGQDVQ